MGHGGLSRRNTKFRKITFWSIFAKHSMFSEYFRGNCLLDDDEMNSRLIIEE